MDEISRSAERLALSLCKCYFYMVKYVVKQLVTKLQLNKCARIIEQLNTYSHDCKECQQLILQLESHLHELKNHLNNQGEIDDKIHKQTINQMVSHLEKKHNLISEGYYISIFLSIGICLGMVFGLTIFDDIALGLPIGLGIGIAIGTGLDADAKKKGKTI